MNNLSSSSKKTKKTNAAYPNFCFRMVNENEYNGRERKQKKLLESYL
jgi:hypothetical protein